MWARRRACTKEERERRKETDAGRTMGEGVGGMGWEGSLPTWMAALVPDLEGSRRGRCVSACLTPAPPRYQPSLYTSSLLSFPLLFSLPPPTASPALRVSTHPSAPQPRHRHNRRGRPPARASLRRDQQQPTITTGPQLPPTQSRLQRSGPLRHEAECPKVQAKPLPGALIESSQQLSSLMHPVNKISRQSTGGKILRHLPKCLPPRGPRIEDMCDTDH